MEMSELAAAMMSQIFSLPQINLRLSSPFRPVADNRRQIANQPEQRNKNHPSAGDKSGQACRGVISVRAARGCGVNIYKLWVGEGDC